ncbi:helix-turn-helix domain-containing protein [Bradyrhizobium diazoefficiens]|nr:helix-turn-helix domain-containing protein [Bradyrhizobium diazoefficiens]MBR0850041.1 helix-turn-helix domain-containing protein [Bradyrhizobium diazoefficiens]
MLVRAATDWTPRPGSLAEPRATSGPRPITCLNEFTYKRGDTIFGESEPAEYVYHVKKGAARRCKQLSGGRRQVVAFHLPGDVFGLENGDVHRFAAEAIVETTVQLIERQSLEAVGESDAATGNLLSMANDNLRHAENHLLLLGRKNSMERVAAFLLEMDERITAARIVSLPMSRRDIADYLGVTLETVSRAISQLHRSGVLDFPSNNQKELVILDRAQLASFDLQG